MSRVSVACVSIVWAGLFCVPGVLDNGHARDFAMTRATLRGLKSISVSVQSLAPELDRAGLSKSQLQTDTELRLRKAAITVESGSFAPGILFVTVDCVSHPGFRRLHGCYVEVDLGQHVMLSRDPSINAFSSTWSVSPVAVVGRANLSNLRNSVADHVDRFINAYLDQNPRR